MEKQKTAAPHVFVIAMLVIPTTISIVRATAGGPAWPCFVGGTAILLNLAAAIFAWRKSSRLQPPA